MADKESSGWMNTTQIADFFGVTCMTIGHWARNSKLEFPKSRVIHNRNYFSRADCNAWMEKQSAAKTVKTVKVGA